MLVELKSMPMVKSVIKLMNQTDGDLMTDDL